MKFQNAGIVPNSISFFWEKVFKKEAGVSHFFRLFRFFSFLMRLRDAWEIIRMLEKMGKYGRVYYRLAAIVSKWDYQSLTRYLLRLA